MRIKVAILTTIIFYLLSNQIVGQEISNIAFDKEGDKIWVSYDLNGVENKLYNISLFLEDHVEKTRKGPLNQISGDVEKVVPGYGKKLYWDFQNNRFPVTGPIGFSIIATLISDTLAVAANIDTATTKKIANQEEEIEEIVKKEKQNTSNVSFSDTKITRQSVASKKVSIYIPIQERIKMEIRKFDEIIRNDLSIYTAKLKSEKKISENVVTDVKAELEETVNQDGEKELNLKVIYKYDVISAKIANKTDDFPPGRYDLKDSRAARLIMTKLKETVEQELAEYLTPGKKVSMKITGKTDGLPIKGLIDYDGEFGDFKNAQCFINDLYEYIDVTRYGGINTNEQLAFLRTCAVRNFIENYISPLKHTQNKFEHHAYVHDSIGGEFRRIEVELTIHNAFAEKYDELKEYMADLTPDSDLIEDIPELSYERRNAYALVISSGEKTNASDGLKSTTMNNISIVSKYFRSTFGIKNENIRIITALNQQNLESNLSWLKQVATEKKTNSKIYVYYNGTVATVKSDNLYEGEGTTFFKNNELLIGKVSAFLESNNNLQLTMFVDGCCNNLNDLSKEVDDKTVIFSGYSNENITDVDEDNPYGLFTYYFLKKLKESNGQISYCELSEYLEDSFSMNDNLDLNILVGDELKNGWCNWYFNK